MAQVIVLQNALHTRTGMQPHPSTPDLPVCASTPPLAQREPGKEDVDRAILFLDIAARQARLLVMEINNPSRRENFETQIATIERLLHLARSMSLRLE
jgi:hypothetical protein